MENSKNSINGGVIQSNNFLTWIEDMEKVVGLVNMECRINMLKEQMEQINCALSSFEKLQLLIKERNFSIDVGSELGSCKILCLTILNQLPKIENAINKGNYSAYLGDYYNKINESAVSMKKFLILYLNKFEQLCNFDSFNSAEIQSLFATIKENLGLPSEDSIGEDSKDNGNSLKKS